MDPRAIRDLLTKVNELQRRQVRYRQGVVTDDSPLSVALGGSDVPYTGVAALPDTYAVGDPVAVLTFGQDLIVLGVINGTPGGGGGGSAHTIEDEGVALIQRTVLDFAGSGVTAADAGGKTVVTIPGGSGGYATVEDEGSALTQRSVLNFQGAGVSAADSGGETVVTIPETDVKAILASLDAGVDIIAWEKVGTSDDVATIYAVVTAGTTTYTTVGSDGFSTDRFAAGDYTVDRLTGLDNAPTVASGVMQAWCNGLVLVGRTVETAVADSRTTFQNVDYTSLSFGSTDPYICVKRLSNGDMLLVGPRTDGSGWDIKQWVKATDTFTNIPGAPSGTTYITPAGTPAQGDWYRIQQVGNVLTMERWTTDPALGGSAASSATYTLTGAFATKFGTGVTGKGGFGVQANTGHYDNYLRESIVTPAEARELWVSVTDELGVTTAKLLLDADGLSDFGHVVKDEGGALTHRSALDFVGAGVTATDDAGGDRTVVTIPGATGGHTIQEEGTPLTARTNLDFVGGGVTATDDAANDATIVTIAGGGASRTYESMLSESSPRNFWPINEASGATSVVDQEAAQNLTATGGVTFGSSGPPVGGASALFAGTGDIKAATAMAAITDNFAIGAWVFVPTGGMYGFVIHTGGNSNGYGIGISLAATGSPLGPTVGVRVFGFYTGVRAINSAYDVTTNAWHHIALARRATTTSVWVDGRQRFSDSGTAPVAPGTGVAIGNDNTTVVDPNRRASNGVKIAKAFSVNRALTDFELSRFARWLP